MNEEDTFSPKTDSTTKPHRTNPSDLSDPLAEEDDINIDREIEQLVSGSKRTKPTKSKGKGDSQPARKKARKLVIESDGENDDYLAEEAVPEEKEDTDDEYHSSEEEKPKTSKGKTKASATRGTKRKAKAAPANSRPALERRTSVEPLPSKKRVKLTLKLDDSLVDGDAASTPDTYDKPSPAPLKYDSPAPQVKKVKLPAIKKTKLPGGPTGSATPTSATPAPPKPKLPLDIGVGSKADTRKSQAATADLDLSNKSVYQELFKTVGVYLFELSKGVVSCFQGSDGNTPRTGLNRRTKEEERRKELHKLKEEYLAKRATEEVFISLPLISFTKNVQSFF